MDEVKRLLAEIAERVDGWITVNMNQHGQWTIAWLPPGKQVFAKQRLGVETMGELENMEQGLQALLDALRDQP